MLMNEPIRIMEMFINSSPGPIGQYSLVLFYKVSLMIGEQI